MHEDLKRNSTASMIEGLIVEVMYDMDHSLVTVEDAETRARRKQRITDFKDEIDRRLDQRQ